jgi:hypothetical protein
MLPAQMNPFLSLTICEMMWFEEKPVADESRWK